MSPAHLSATVPDKRLPTYWPSPQTLGHTLLYLGKRRGVAGRGSPGQPGPEASENIHLCAERAPWRLTGAPFMWVTGVGQSGTWGAGRWGKMVLMRWHWHVTVTVLKSPLSCGLLFSLHRLFSKRSPVTRLALTGHRDACGRSRVWMDQPFPRGSFKPVKHSAGQQIRSLPTLRLEFEKLSFGDDARTVQPSPQPHGC